MRCALIGMSSDLLAHKNYTVDANNIHSVSFAPHMQLLKLENRTRGMIPLKASLCSYKCFNSQDHEFYGIAAPVT